MNERVSGACAGLVCNLRVLWALMNLHANILMMRAEQIRCGYALINPVRASLHVS